MTIAATRPHVPALREVRVEDAMHRGVLTVPLEAPLETVARMMSTYHVHCIVALDEGSDDVDSPRVWGLISDLDLTAIASAEDIEGRSAGGSAATEVLTISPTETVERAAQLMAEHGISHVIAVDPTTGRPLGVLSTLDVARVLSGRIHKHPLPTSTAVEELMTKDVLTVDPDRSLKDVAKMLIEHDISALPVMDGDVVVGVVSETDIVAKERGDSSWHPNLLERALQVRDAAAERLGARTAGEAMTSPAITIDSWRPPAAAASLMIEHGINRLPVLKQDQLVGIISRSDLVRAFARPDEDIALDIREDVVLRAFWLPSEQVEVEVFDGEVTLRGELDSKLAVDMIPEAVRRIPGVVGVRSELRHRPEHAESRHWLRTWPTR
jgi:CBS domain-containing protein